jgi:N-acetylglucosaminyl-diphospho-decaprenol L-rhamnosyltransferase
MVSLLVVNYRSSALALDAIRSARAASTAPLQVVVVDNSCDPLEADALRRVSDELIVADRNLGYAAAINAGRRRCDSAAIVVTNPDVTFGPSSIDRLLAALDDAAATGPAIFWDSQGQWHLPPGDLGTGLEKVDQILASRSRAWFELRDRRRARRRFAFWSLARTTPVRMLSGAVMAIRTGDFDAVGGFDERFPLYFEENDFLRRLAALRRRIAYVPEARCRHIYNQSAAQVAAEAASRYATSEMKYLEKWNGPLAAQMLKKLERALPSQEPVESRRVLTIPRRDVVVEISPLASFSTAAGHFPQGDRVEIPHEILASVATPLYGRTVDRRTGIVLETYRITP